jgi:hydroxypyruvate reductase
MTLPPDAVSLADLQTTTDLLLAAGAGITELNTVRKHVDRLKGGRLAEEAAPGRVLALVLSDVVGDSLEVIASGPVTPDPTTFADAVSVLERFEVWQRVPLPVRVHLTRGAAGEIAESPAPGAACFERVVASIVGNNRLAAKAALAEAARRGYRTHLVTTELTGEARAAAARLAALAREVTTGGRPIAPPACLVAAGETTVTVRGGGRGGRNQELALALALRIEGLDEVLGVSVGTDGIDGPTDAAGAIVSGRTVQRARELGLDPARALAENDSYPFFEALGDLVVTGPTGTNVMDIQILLVKKR